MTTNFLANSGLAMFGRSMKAQILFDRTVNGMVKNVPFNDLCSLLRKLGFEQRQKGSHHIFSCEGVIEIVNLQPNGKDAKACQVRQVREIIERYQLSLQRGNRLVR